MDLRKKRRILILLVLLGIGLVIAYALTKSQWIDLCLHTFVRSLCLWAIVRIIRPVFHNQLKGHAPWVMPTCIVILALDLIVVDAIRYYVKDGVRTILFLPACIPLVFLIDNLASERGKENAKARVLALGIGVLLLVFSLYTEVLSFMSA